MSDVGVCVHVDRHLLSKSWLLYSYRVASSIKPFPPPPSTLSNTENKFIYYIAHIKWSKSQVRSSYKIRFCVCESLSWLRQMFSHKSLWILYRNQEKGMWIKTRKKLLHSQSERVLNVKTLKTCKQTFYGMKISSKTRMNKGNGKKIHTLINNLRINESKIQYIESDEEWAVMRHWKRKVEIKRCINY